jgi:hypothetical protein
LFVPESLANRYQSEISTGWWEVIPRDITDETIKLVLVRQAEGVELTL